MYKQNTIVNNNVTNYVVSEIQWLVMKYFRNHRVKIHPSHPNLHY